MVLLHHLPATRTKLSLDGASILGTVVPNNPGLVRGALWED